MKDFVLTLLATIVSAAITVSTPYLIDFLKKKSSQVQEQAKSEKEKNYITEITEAISTAVASVSQTFVDALKKSNKFTKEAQEEAFNKAKETALAIMSDEAKNFISSSYGDISTYLKAKIEETVRENKTE